MKETVMLIKKVLDEKRHLDDQEMHLIITYLLNYYNLNNEVTEVIFDYYNRSKAVASYLVDDKIIYFNMQKINEQVFYDYNSKKEYFSFNEYFIIVQLMLILHEIRHVIQNSKHLEYHDILKRIILVCREMEINGNYTDNYELFPIEKDAEVFAFDKLIEILRNCFYFDEMIIRKLQIDYFFTLIKGYNFSLSKDGSLKDFYLEVVKDGLAYEKILNLANELTIYDKLAFNFSLNNEELHQLLLVPGLIENGFSPNIVLKKRRKY